jgi:hypothetical protein
MRRFAILLSSAAVLVGLGSTAAQAATPNGTGGVPPPAGVVSAVPASNTPHLKATSDSPVEQIRQLVQCGNMMYAVGSFSAILKGSTTYTRSNIFSFKATSPYTVSSWAPNVVGSTGTGGNNAIDTIALSSDCADAYIGGKFSSVNGTSVKNIAEITTANNGTTAGNGSVVTTFGHSASGAVETLLNVGGHILAGGYYTSINNSTADPYMTSLNPTTGKDDGFVHLNISGNYQFTGVTSNATRVYNQALSHGGTLDLVMGDFTSVGGLPRQQIFMLNLATNPASVTPWTSPEWDGSQGEATPSNPNNGYPYECATVEPFYIQAAAWSPDDSRIYIGTTGFHPNGWPTGSTPRTGLCDAAAAFPATTTGPVLHTWVNYTGCDSLYSAAADANAAYFGGHERWSMNPRGCDSQGPGAYPAPGMEGLSPATGALFVNSAGTAGYYSRARGLGADDMLVTSAGLWIASDNSGASQMCGGTLNLSGICFLPYG